MGSRVWSDGLPFDVGEKNINSLSTTMLNVSGREPFQSLQRAVPCVGLARGGTQKKFWSQFDSQNSPAMLSVSFTQAAQL